MKRESKLPGIFVLLWLLSAMSLLAQANLPIYTDNLVNGFQDWSWIPRNFANTSPVHSGTYSISASATGGNQGLSFENSIYNPYAGGFNIAPYQSLNFWVNGGAGGGQKLEVFADYYSNSVDVMGPPLLLGTLSANAWQQFVIRLSALVPAGVTNLFRLSINLLPTGATNTFYVDDVFLAAKSSPALQHLSVDAQQTIRTADPRWFGANFGIWDSYMYSPQTFTAIKEAGILNTRFPGGSLSDQYDWRTGLTTTWVNGLPTQTNDWADGRSTFYYVATNLGLQSFITVNYGSGTSNEAAAWVLDANVTNHCHFKYWEVGNECYGSWEQDTNNPPYDPYTYAVRFAGYYALMKAADPTIEVGAVSNPGEDEFDTYTTHPATNSVTGQVHYGWTPVMLATMKSLGVTPDFLIYHFYPENTPYTNPPPANDSDALLLQLSPQIADDATNLRMMINDYFGAGGSNIELVNTEINSDSGAVGKQSTSLVNAAYLADTLGTFMKTELNAYTFFNFRGQAGQLDTWGNFDPSVYGWRDYGDYGLLNNNTSAYYPDFYAMKLMQYFVRPGDTILNATTDFPFLSAYASRRADGSLCLLVINKDATNAFTAQVSLTNFVPSATATIHSYGMPQDNAVENNLATNLQDIAVSSFSGVAPVFTNSFAPLSLTLFTFAPAAPSLNALPAAPGQFVLRLNGQPGTPYVIQSSTNLRNWNTVSTNFLAGSFFNLTNSTAGTNSQFWRAVWQP